MRVVGKKGAKIELNRASGSICLVLGQKKQLVCLV